VASSCFFLLVKIALAYTCSSHRFSLVILVFLAEFWWIFVLSSIAHRLFRRFMCVFCSVWGGNWDVGSSAASMKMLTMRVVGTRRSRTTTPRCCVSVHVHILWPYWPVVSRTWIAGALCKRRWPRSLKTEKIENWSTVGSWPNILSRSRALDRVKSDSLRGSSICIFPIGLFYQAFSFVGTRNALQYSVL
jgi:hypothetical protein